jgi:hypothetical protein
MVAFLSTTGCGSEDSDPYLRVTNYEGRLAADLLRDVGPPSRSRSLAATGKRFTCDGPSDRPATRELSYDIPSRGFWKWAYDTLGVSPARTYVVCVDDRDRITSVWVVDIN